MKIKNKILYIVSIFVLMFTLSCTDETKEVVKLPSIIEVAEADPSNYSIFIDALKKTGLYTTVSNPGSFTIFLPTNAAFKKAGYTSELINALNEKDNKQVIDDLRLTLQYHVLGVGTRSSDLLFGVTFKTFAFYKATATATSGANLNIIITKTDSDVLLNGGESNKGAKIEKLDIEASNGVVHVIDTVLSLPNVVNLVKSYPDLSTLLAVVTSAPQSTVLTTLTNATPSATAAITVYAPSNAAFVTATQATSGYLVGKTDAQVTSILNYHLQRGNNTSNSATSYTASAVTTDFVPVTTLLTSNTFSIPRNTVRIIDKSSPVVNANIRVVNIQGINGVIHVIDKVLQPF